MREKLGKMKSMQRKINEELRRHEILVVTTKEDAAHGESTPFTSMLPLILYNV